MCFEGRQVVDVDPTLLDDETEEVMRVVYASLRAERRVGTGEIGIA